MKPRRLNRYNCKCGNSMLSEDVDEGVTPFFMRCGACDAPAQSNFYKVHADDFSLPADIEWYKPTKKETSRLTKPMQEHVQQGGLLYRVISNRPGVRMLRAREEKQYAR